MIRYSNKPCIIIVGQVVCFSRSQQENYIFQGKGYFLGENTHKNVLYNRRIILKLLPALITASSSLLPATKLSLSNLRKLAACVTHVVNDIKQSNNLLHSKSKIFIYSGKVHIRSTTGIMLNLQLFTCLCIWIW